MDNNNNKYKSYFFLKNKKKNNAKEFLLTMNKNMLIKTLKEIQLLEQYGIDLKYCRIKKFQNDIWKIKIKDNNSSIRLFFYFYNNNIYYLYGFYKKTQKTPDNKKIKINNLKIELLNNSNNIKEFSEEININEFLNNINKSMSF